MGTNTETRTAISILNSRTFWWNALNGIVAVLSLTEVIALMPADWLPIHAAIIAVGNVWLRMLTVRPAAFIAPNTTAQVQVAKLEPTNTNG